VYLASYLVEKEVSIEVLECLGLELSKDTLIQKLMAEYEQTANTIEKHRSHPNHLIIYEMRKTSLYAFRR
jgi:hypothetical protein